MDGEKDEILHTCVAALSCFVTALRRVENGLYSPRDRAEVRTTRAFWERRLVTVRRRLGLTDEPARPTGRDLTQCANRIDELWSEGLPSRRRDELLIVTLADLRKLVVGVIDEACASDEEVAALFRSRGQAAAE